MSLIVEFGACLNEWKQVQACALAGAEAGDAEGVGSPYGDLGDSGHGPAAC